MPRFSRTPGERGRDGGEPDATAEVLAQAGLTEDELRAVAADAQRDGEFGFKWPPDACGRYLFGFPPGNGRKSEQVTDQARVTIRQASCPPKPNPFTCSTPMPALAGAWVITRNRASGSTSVVPATCTSVPACIP